MKLIDKMHTVEDLKRYTFDEREHQLLKYSRKAVISTGTETSEHDTEPT